MSENKKHFSVNQTVILVAFKSSNRLLSLSFKSPVNPSHICRRLAKEL